MSFAELREYNQRKQAEEEEEHQTEEQTEEEEHQTEEEEHSEGEEKEELEEKENAVEEEKEELEQKENAEEEEEVLEEKDSPEEEDEEETEEKKQSEEEEEKTEEQEKKKKKKSKKKKKKTVEQQSEEQKHKTKSKKRKRKDNEEETVEQQSEERKRKKKKKKNKKQKKKPRTEEHPKGIPPRPIGSPRGQRYAVSPTQSSERTTSADHSPRVSQDESEAYHTPVDEASTGIHSSSPQPEHREDVNVEEQEDHENHVVDDWEMDDGGMGDGGMGDGVMHPLGFYVLRSEWKKSIKIATRSYIGKAANNIEKILNADELDWFLKHEQFKHFFHMPRDTNHKSMGLWLLTARTCRIEKKNEAWFLVNGGAIRYSLKEHALLSGLHCHDYPPNYQDKGSFDFVVKHFDTDKVTYNMLEKEFLGMKRYRPHRKKMAVLYFLASVLKGNVKRGKDEGPIDSFLLKVVGNLKDCVTFPWGRWTFDECMQNLSNMMEKLEGITLGPKPSTPFPSFITPLEILAFEAIPCLGEEYRKPYKGAHVGCPRMCKSTFKTSTMRGFTIEEIHETLGETKDITSIIEPRREEQHLLDGLVLSEDRFDPVVDGWTNRLLQNQPVFFEELHKEDVLCRKAAGQPSQQSEKEAEEPLQPSHPDVGDHNVVNDGVGSVGGPGWMQELQAMVKGVEETMELGFAAVNERVDITNGRIDVLEIRMNDMEVTQRGEALNRDLPEVIYSEYHGPSHLFTDPAVGEEEPEITEKVVSDAEKEKQSDDAAGDAEKEAESDAEKDAGSDAEKEGDKEGADGDDDDEDEGGDGKQRKTYSDLRKPPFERKVLRERKKK